MNPAMFSGALLFECALIRPALRREMIDENSKEKQLKGLYYRLPQILRFVVACTGFARLLYPRFALKGLSCFRPRSLGSFT